MSRLMTKPTKWHERPAKTQISLGIHPGWSESSLSAWRKLGSLATHWTHSKDSDQTGRMLRLIWVFAGRTDHFVGFVMRRLICEISYRNRSTTDELLRPVKSRISQGGSPGWTESLLVHRSFVGFVVLQVIHKKWFTVTVQKCSILKHMSHNHEKTWHRVCDHLRLKRACSAD